MTKEELISRMKSVVDALNGIELHGRVAYEKQNFLNLYGCISILDESISKIISDGITEDDEACETSDAGGR